MKFSLTLSFIFITLLSGCHSESELNSYAQCKKHYRAESYKVALRKCLVGAENGHIDSQWLVANIYIKGLAGERQPDKAIQWLNKAADNGHTAAQRELGKAYMWGNGVERNPDMALDWLKLAARDRDTEAEFTIGIFYLGDGKRKSDQASAMNWFKKAAASGHKMAINNLAWLYSTSPNPSLRNGEQAVKIMRPLIEKSPDSSVLLDTFAAAFAEAGDFDKAIEAQTKAIEHLPEKIRPQVRKGYHERADFYKNGKAWRESLPDWSTEDNYPEKHEEKVEKSNDSEQKTGEPNI